MSMAWAISTNVVIVKVLYIASSRALLFYSDRWSRYYIPIYVTAAFAIITRAMLAK